MNQTGKKDLELLEEFQHQSGANGPAQRAIGERLMKISEGLKSKYRKTLGDHCGDAAGFALEKIFRVLVDPATSKFDGRGSLDAYAATIMERVFIDYYRHLKLEKSNEVSIDADANGDGAALVDHLSTEGWVSPGQLDSNSPVEQEIIGIQSGQKIVDKLRALVGKGGLVGAVASALLDEQHQKKRNGEVEIQALLNYLENAMPDIFKGIADRYAAVRRAFTQVRRDVLAAI